MIAGVPQRTEGIVLRVLDYGESDRIVTLCTAGFGKIRGIAKGARRSRRRFANALEPFSLLQVLFSRRRPESLARIDSCDVVSHFSGIRSDLEKTMIASCLIDLADQFAPEDKANESLFRLLGDFLRLLEEGPVPAGILRFFEIRLLGLSGYDPVLDRCLVCNRAVCRGEGYRFSAAGGGLICSACRPDSPDTIPVSLGTILTLRMGREMEIDRIGRLLFSEQSAEESRLLLAHFIRHLLGREPRSVHVLNEIRRLGMENGPDSR
jgi:DNA repair protein RecO (recombination protein O)